jgi:hypothetical protein
VFRCAGLKKKRGKNKKIRVNPCWSVAEKMGRKLVLCIAIFGWDVFRGQLAELLLETLGKIIGAGETDFQSDFYDTDAPAFHYFRAALETDGSDEFRGRFTR